MGQGRRPTRRAAGTENFTSREERCDRMCNRPRGQFEGLVGAAFHVPAPASTSVTEVKGTLWNGEFARIEEKGL